MISNGHTRLCVLLWVSVLLSQFGCVQAPTQPQPQPQQRPAFELDTAIRLPMRLVKNIPMVPVKINGKGPFWFTVDTGSGFPAGISKRLAAKLGLMRRGSILASAGGQHKRVPLTRLGLLELGEASFDDVPAIVLDSAGFRRALGDEFGGILGYPLFEQWLLTLDYPRRKVVLDIGSLRPPDGKRRVRLIASSDQTPGIVVQTARYKIPIMIDSGNSMGFTLYTRMAKGLSLKYPPRRGPRSTTINGRVTARVSRLEGSLFIGQHEIAQPRVYLLAHHASLGGELLQRFSVTFDQQSGVVRFER